MYFIPSLLQAKNWKENQSRSVFIVAFIKCTKRQIFFFPPTPLELYWILFLKLMYTCIYKFAYITVQTHSPAALCFQMPWRLLWTLQGITRIHIIAVEKAFSFFRYQECLLQEFVERRKQTISGRDQCTNSQHEWTLQSSWNRCGFIFRLNICPIKKSGDNR